VTETLYEAITAGEKDYSALVTKLKNEGIEVIYLGGYHTEAGLIIRQAKEQGLDAVLVSGDALVSSEYASIAGPAGDGTLFTFSPDPRKNPEASEVVKEFQAEGYDPEGYTLYTYGAVQAWVAAVEAAGSTDVEAVSAKLKSMEFNTVMGTFGFDDIGDVTAPGYVFYEWANGTYDYYTK
jgi:branched-chain amino acid transport system substrate-binding protein